MNPCLLLAVAFIALINLPASGQTDWVIRSSGTTNNISSIAFGSGVFVVCDGRPIMSSNGISWNRPNWPSGAMAAVFYGGGEFIAFGSNEEDGTGYIWKSKNGYVGSRSTAPNAWGEGRLRDSEISAAYANDQWVVCGPRFAPAVISPTSQMTAIANPPWGSNLYWVIAYKNGFLAGGDRAIFASDDGTGWRLLARTQLSYGQPVVVGDVLYSNYGRSEDGGKTWIDWNGDNWYSRKVVFARDLFVGCGAFSYPDSTFIKTSLDGKTWTQRETGSTSSLLSVAYGKDIFVAVGFGGRLITSSAITPLPPVIAPLVTVTPSVTLKWPSTLSLQYQPETSNDLKVWTAFGSPITGAGPEIIRTFEITDQRKYFRVTVK